MENGYTTITLSVEKRGVSPTINIVGKAEYPWFEASALHLVGSAGRSLLLAGQIERNHHGRMLSTTTDELESTHGKKNGHYTSRDTMK